MKFIKLIPASLRYSHKELEDSHTEATKAGFEGTVIKNLAGLYEHNVRSSQQFKYKEALDAEYKILSYTLDKNQHPVFTCVTPEGATFSVKPKGTSAERTAIISNFESLYKNQYYTIEYETLSKDNIPLKPVGIALRNCSPSGKPLE